MKRWNICWKSKERNVQTSEIETLTEEQRDALELLARGELARQSFDLDSYSHFHFCIYNHEYEPHEEEWLRQYFQEWDRDDDALRGLLNKAARGLRKSTDTIGFVLFVIGHFPHLSHLVIQARDEDAKKTGNFMADIIESNAGWKSAFPHVTPDKERGWSQNGYHVKDTSVDYGEWVQKCTKDHKRDPSFMTASVLAGSIGMHPTGTLVMDDIHDSKNTESLAEMTKTVSTVKADIMPTMTKQGKKPLFLVAYTPWKSDDTYAVLEQSGLFKELVTPVYVEDENGIEFRDKKIKLTCPKIYSIKVLEQQWMLLGEREFSRQLLCKLDYGRATSLPYYSYESSGIEYTFPAFGGADPTGSEPDLENKGKQRSFFALGYVVKLPQGGALVLDGVLEQCSHVEAENYILNAQSLFTQWNFTMVENVGPGLVFYNNAKRNQNLRVLPSDLITIDEKDRKRISSKDDRILQMAKWFESGTVKIANKNTPFLNALRYLFDHFWELNKNHPHPAWDAGDAVYHALKAMPDIFVIQDFSRPIPQPGQKIKMGLATPWS